MFSFIKSIFDKFIIAFNIKKKSGHKSIIKDSPGSSVFQVGRDLIMGSQKEKLMSGLEQKILKKLYTDYKTTGRRLPWKITDAYKELGIKDGDYVGMLNNSPYIELAGEHCQITDEGIRLMDSRGIDSALINYEVASRFPGTTHFNFLKDWRVWFLLQNLEKKKYKAYIKIKFTSDDYKEDIKNGHYGGIKVWDLNSLDKILAPGLTIPERIKEKAKQKKRIEIKIFCEIRDENNELIEEKLPRSYIYDYNNNNWYYEPGD
jgi:hypothetical protein